MQDWDAIMKEAERLQQVLKTKKVDLNEAKKAGDYYLSQDCDDEKMLRYLKALVSNTPERSRKSIQTYRGINDIWQGWKTTLAGRDKARAWGWAVRLANKSDV